MTNRVLITGITGQDGSYLAEFMLNDGWEVHGLVRRSSTPNTERLEGLLHQIVLHPGDMTDLASLINILKEVQPQQIYNLAAQSHVGYSFDAPLSTLDITGVGAVRLMEAAFQVVPNVRFYQASSSEMYGVPRQVPQNEDTPFNPISPYAVAKVMAHHYAKMYREKGLFISCGILNNHESERRGSTFLTSKVAKAAAQRQHVTLGNLNAVRDWGYAPEYVAAMRLILDQRLPEDFVLGTGVGHRVRDFVAQAYAQVGLDWQEYVHFNEALVRPIEAGPLVADPCKALKVLWWKPQHTFVDLVARMVEHFRFIEGL